MPVPHPTARSVCTYSYDITPVVAHPVANASGLQVEQPGGAPLEWKLYLIQVRCCCYRCTRWPPCSWPCPCPWLALCAAG